MRYLKNSIGLKRSEIKIGGTAKTIICFSGLPILFGAIVVRFDKLAELIDQFFVLFEVPVEHLLNLC